MSLELDPIYSSMTVEVDASTVPARITTINGVSLPDRVLFIPDAQELPHRMFSERAMRTVVKAFEWAEQSRPED